MPAPILPLIEAVTHWPERGALVGLDLGTKTVGVAVSDPDRRLATGVETLHRTAFKADAARLRANVMPSASCSACRSTWTAARVRARNRPAPLPAISPTSPALPSRCGTSGY